MTTTSLISVGLVVAGLLVVALISEYSFRGVENETKGALLAAFSKLRLVHLVAIILLIIVSFIVPGSFWFGAVAYFALATVLAVRKLSGLQLPKRLRQLQAASVLSVFIGVASAGVVSWLS